MAKKTLIAKPKKTYTVLWACQVLAEDPEEAAREAFVSVSRGTARCFEVYDEKVQVSCSIKPLANVDLLYEKP